MAYWKLSKRQYWKDRSAAYRHFRANGYSHKDAFSAAAKYTGKSNRSER